MTVAAQPSTADLNGALLKALGENVAGHSDLAARPLTIELVPPNPLRLRVYLWPLVDGTGTVRGSEMKINVRLPGQRSGEYAGFDYSDERLPVMAGFSRDLGVFVLWDATLRDRVMYAGNQQVKWETVEGALVDGWAVQSRRLRSGFDEAVIACRSRHLLRALTARVLSSGGVREGEWPASLS